MHDDDRHPVELIRIARGQQDFLEAVTEFGPDLVVVDTSDDEEEAFAAISALLDHVPSSRILALTPHPAPFDHVARAMRLGALGYVSADSPATEIAEAASAVASGELWLPAERSRDVFASVGDDRVLTAAERQDRLRNFVLGLIPLTGGLTAVMSILWRRYLGQIGVRPVDLAIDPTTRIVDALFSVFVLVAVFGPLLFIGSWLDLLSESDSSRLRRWLARHRRLARIGMAILIVTALSTFTAFAEIVMALFVGPIVALLLAAKAFDIDDELPRALRPTRLNPGRTAIGAGAVLLFGLTVLSAEVIAVGPQFAQNGAAGIIAPRVLGFSATPVMHIEVDGSREPRPLLYLGGNADLYVLVDPCDGDKVEIVSVGSSRLNVIDTVPCP